MKSSVARNKRPACTDEVDGVDTASSEVDELLALFVDYRRTVDDFDPAIEEALGMLAEYRRTMATLGELPTKTPVDDPLFLQLKEPRFVDLALLPSFHHEGNDTNLRIAMEAGRAKFRLRQKGPFIDGTRRVMQIEVKT